MTNMIDVKRLKELVDVEYDTGFIFWRPRVDADFDANGHGGSVGARKRFNALFAGKRALAHMSKGYFKGRICGVELKAHRVVWAHFHGVWPSGVVDHVNRITYDNRIENLRDVSSWQNGLNRESAVDHPFIYCAEKPFFGSRTIDGVVYSIAPQKSKEDAMLAWAEVEKSQIDPRHWVYSK